jgi:hypothetical protein
MNAVIDEPRQVVCDCGGRAIEVELPGGRMILADTLSHLASDEPVLLAVGPAGAARPFRPGFDTLDADEYLHRPHRAPDGGVCRRGAI